MKWLTTVVFSLFLTNVTCARILAWSPLGTKSHQNIFLPLLGELAKKGHDITYVANYECKLPIRQVILHELGTLNQQTFNLFDGYEQSGVLKRLQILKSVGNFTATGMEVVYQSEKVKQVLKEKFDLMLLNMAFVDLFTPLLYTSQPSTAWIVISPNNLLTSVSPILGDLERTDHVPFILSGFTDRMNFLERVINTVASETVNFFFVQFSVGRSQAKARSYLEDFPYFKDILRNVSLVFINTHVSTSYLRTLPPGVIEIGGVHCRDAQPLPEDLEAFIRQFKDGFIVFAVGSAIPMDKMDQVLVSQLANAFGRLSVGVIWQWKGNNPPRVPSNVKLVQWLPQQDLLGHPKMRAILTHGGLFSIQEAIYHGVPLLGMPLGNDQDLNVNRAVHEEYGVRVDWKGLTEKKLYNTIQELLPNPKYKANVQRFSRLLRDQPQTPLQRAVFWTEFAIRHNGTQPFRSAARDLLPYQQALLDVYAFILTVTVFITILFITLLKFLYKKCRQGKRTYKRKPN